jgi:hypothetical protein
MSTSRSIESRPVLRPPPPVHEIAQRVAARLDEVVEARTQHWPVRPGELREALARLKKARAAAASAIAHLSVVLHRDSTSAAALAFRDSYDLASLDRFGALIADGAELLAVDVEVAAAMRRFAAQFDRPTIAPEAAE